MHPVSGIAPKSLPKQVGGTRLWLVEARGTPSDRAELFQLLSADEQERASRFKSEDARDTAVVSRGVLRQILGETLGCAPESLEFREGEHGKPFLAGKYLGSRLEFNVAHSGDVVLYAVSQAMSRIVSPPEAGSVFRGRAVGVDVELKKPSLDVERMAERYFAPGEWQQLRKMVSRQERLASFYRCWTRKEAYLKARGTGLTTKLDAFEVTLLPGVEPALVHTEVEDEDASDWTVCDVPVPDGYFAALVVGS